MSPTSPDPFDTAGLRAAVLGAWRSSPTRFREDANVEDDYARGAYRDRLVVELAQNASDAARAAGVAGRLFLRVDDDSLTAANVGAPLDRAGVESLAAMRASSKAEGDVGRFGVGFAAVLMVSDAPQVRSRDGGVRFDRSQTEEQLRRDPELAGYLELRPPPLLRLPFPAGERPPEGYETAVVLPWRDAAARTLGVTAVDRVDEMLLLALPDLDEVIVEIADEHGAHRRRWQIDRASVPWSVRHDDRTSWWRAAAISGGIGEVEAGSLPHEEALRRRWSASVLVPVNHDGVPVPLPSSVAPVVHAPTPTDEPWQLPVVAIGDFALDASRRRVAEGQRTDAVVDGLATAYVTAVDAIAREHGPAALTLVPGTQLAGSIDHRVRELVRHRLAGMHWVPRVIDGSLQQPVEVVALEPSDPVLVHVLGEHLGDLADPDWVGDALRRLGMPTRPVSDVWDLLANLTLTPRQWHAVYDAAESIDPRMLEGLPVPLADGRVMRNARATVLAAGQEVELALLGLDVVASEAEHPLLERLGAQPLDVRRALDHDLVHRVADAVDRDPAEARRMVGAAATLVADAGVRPGELVALAGLPVPTRGGGWAPAATVVLPGSAVDAVAGPAVPRLDDELTSSAASAVWAALGVVAGIVPVTLVEQPLDPALWDQIFADGGDWCLAVADRAGVSDPAELFVPEVVIPRGLDLVDSASLDQLMALLDDPDVRRALVSPTLVLTGGGGRATVPSPGAWWLSESPILDGRYPIEVRVAGDERLAPFFPDVIATPDTVDVALLEAIGVHTTVERWLAAPDGPDELLDALADESVEVRPSLLAELYRQLAALHENRLPERPERVRAMVGSGTAVVDAGAVVVAVAPHHAHVLRTPFVPGSEPLADLLGVDISDDASCDASGLSGGVDQPVPAVVGVGDAPGTYREHDELTVGGVAVDWWVTDAGGVHATTLDGLARALAWRTGQWRRRFELAALLERPELVEEYDAEALYDR